MRIFADFEQEETNRTKMQFAKPMPFYEAVGKLGARLKAKNVFEKCMPS